MPVELIRERFAVDEAELFLSQAWDLCKVVASVVVAVECCSTAVIASPVNPFGAERIDEPSDGLPDIPEGIGVHRQRRRPRELQSNVRVPREADNSIDVLERLGRSVTQYWRGEPRPQVVDQEEDAGIAFEQLYQAWVERMTQRQCDDESEVCAQLENIVEFAAGDTLRLAQLQDANADETARLRCLQVLAEIGHEVSMSPATRKCSG